MSPVLITGLRLLFALMNLANFLGQDAESWGAASPSTCNFWVSSPRILVVFFFSFSCKLTPKFLSVPLKEFLQSLLCTPVCSLSSPFPPHFMALIFAFCSADCCPWLPGSTCLCPLEKSSSFQNPIPLHCGSAPLFTLNWVWEQSKLCWLSFTALCHCTARFRRDGREQRQPNR